VFGCKTEIANVQHYLMVFAKASITYCSHLRFGGFKTHPTLLCYGHDLYFNLCGLL